MMQVPLEATLPAFHPIIGSLKLCIRPMEHVPKLH